MISKFLNNIGSFSSGAFAPTNTGAVGSGWGISTPTTFVAVEKEYDLYSTGGLTIDLYSLFEMNPKVELNFDMDTGEFVYNKEYFKIVKTNNIINIIPNTMLLKNDNFLSKTFILPIYYYKAGESLNSQEILNLKINYNSSSGNQNGPIELKLEYDNLNLSIALASLVKEYITGGLNGTFEILTINSRTMDSLLLNQNDLIRDQFLVLDKVSLLDPEIKLNYKDPTSSINYIFNIFFKLRDQNPPKTIVSDIYTIITPKDASFIDIKEYVVGDTYGLVLDEVYDNNWSPLNGSDYITFDIADSYISIIPKTKNLIDEIIGLKDSVQFVKTFKYHTPESAGIFTLYLTIEMKNVIRVLDDYKLLVPTLTSKILKISNKEIGLKKPINLLGLVKNSYFPLVEELNEYGEIRGTLVAPIIDNINISNVEKPTLFSTNKTLVPGVIKIRFEFPYAYSLTATLKLEEDTPKYEEYFKVTPIVLNISKNYTSIINIYDYIFTDAENYKYLDFDFPNPILNLGGGNISLPLSWYDGNIDKDESITGSIPVTLVNKYTNDSNTDDYGNIIGYREIPFIIIKSTLDNDIDTSEDLSISDIKIYLNPIKSIMVDGLNFDRTALGGVDRLKLETKETEFLKVEINPLTNLDVNLINQGDSISGDKAVIILDTFNIWALIYEPGYFVDRFNDIPIDGKIVLDLEYKNSNNEIKNYIQNLYFYKL